MADLKVWYHRGTTWSAGQDAIATTGIGALPDGQMWSSDVFDNTDNAGPGHDDVDHLLQFDVVLAAAATPVPGYISVYIAASIDGSLWPDGVDFTPGVHNQSAPPWATWEADTTIPLLKKMVVPVTFAGVTGTPLSVKDLFGGTLPPYYVILILNRSGEVLDVAGNQEFLRLSVGLQGA